VAVAAHLQRGGGLLQLQLGGRRLGLLAGEGLVHAALLGGALLGGGSQLRDGALQHHLLLGQALPLLHHLPHRLQSSGYA
jgi:hypothetical protein